MRALKVPSLENGLIEAVRESFYEAFGEDDSRRTRHRSEPPNC
jgi:hypothetical protein